MHRMDIQATARRAQRSGLIFQGQYGAPVVTAALVILSKTVDIQDAIRREARG
jgi:hypothetical protein